MTRFYAVLEGTLLGLILGLLIGAALGGSHMVIVP